MSMRRHVTSATLHRSALLTALLLALPLIAPAQQAPAASSSSAATMDMGAMPGMDHGSMDHGMHGMTKPVATKPKKKKKEKAAVKPASPAKTVSDMPEMDHGAMSGMDRQAMPGMSHEAAQHTDSMAGMTMGSMQGGSAPPDARSPDYSDGLNYGLMEHLTMHGAALFGMLLFDQLEAFDGNRGSGQTWEAQGWYGNDVNKVWVRSEGDRSRGTIEDGDVEVFWNRNVATFWSTQLGVRHELGDGRGRNWAAFGIQGLAPYWFELEATGYVGPSGRTAARVRADYELLFTQRLILQPEFEVNLYGKSDSARRIGRGLSDAQLGLRLRYEIRRQFAPYVGVVWTRRFGATADFARDDHQAIVDRQWVAGVRIWF